MKFIITLLITVVSFTLFGQKNQKGTSDSNSKKILIGLSHSPDYSFRTLKNNKGVLLNGLDNITQSGILGHTLGLNMIYYLKKNIGIGLGVQYSNKGYQNKLTFGDQIDPRRGFVWSSPSGENVLKKGKLEYNYYFVDIPLKIDVVLGKKKIHFVISAGITTNIFLKATQVLILKYENRTEKESFYTPDDPTKVNISPFISAGLEWNIKNKSTFRFEPTIKYTALEIIDFYPPSFHLWSAGLNVSYYFTLK